jgi:hypothetical protein
VILSGERVGIGLRELEKEIGLIEKYNYPNRDWYRVYRTFRMGWSDPGSPRVVESYHIYINGLSTIPKFEAWWRGIRMHPYDIREGYLTDGYFSTLLNERFWTLIVL